MAKVEHRYDPSQEPGLETVEKDTSSYSNLGPKLRENHLQQARNRVMRSPVVFTPEEARILIHMFLFSINASSLEAISTLTGYPPEVISTDIDKVLAQPDLEALYNTIDPALGLPTPTIERPIDTPPSAGTIAERNRQIITLWQAGRYSQQNLAQAFNLSRTTIKAIVRGVYKNTDTEAQESDNITDSFESW